MDDTRESPTLQLLDVIREKQESQPVVYDPYITSDIVPNQVHDLDSFLSMSDLIVIMVGHHEIRSSLMKLDGRIVFDTRNICPKESAYKL